MLGNICLFLPSMTIGGVTAVAKKLANGINRQKKTKITILTLKSIPDEFVSDLDCEVNIVPIVQFKRFLIQAWKSKIIFLPSYHSIPIAFLCFSFLFSQCYFVIDRKVSSYKKGDFYSRLYYYLFFILPVLSSGFIFTYKKAQVDFLKKYHAKSIFINYPVSDEFFNYESLEKSIDILYAGRLEDEKGVIYLLESINLIKLEMNIELKVTILGSGNNKQSLIHYCERNNLSNIKFVDYVSDVYMYMYRAKLFVLPSINEGCASVIKECIVCRLPAVVTDVDTGGPQEAINFGSYGEIARPGSANSLKDKILKALNKSYDDCFREKIIKKLSIDYAAKSYLSFMDEL